LVSPDKDLQGLKLGEVILKGLGTALSNYTNNPGAGHGKMQWTGSLHADSAGDALANRMYGARLTGRGPYDID